MKIPRNAFKVCRSAAAGLPPRFRCLFVALAFAASAAPAQQYPLKTVRIIATEAGGSTDIVARTIGPRLSARWNQPVVVENRGGAAGIIGAELAAKAPADGYTLFIGHTGTLAINPSLYKSLPYDPVRDFAPIALILATPLIVVVHPALPVKSMNELIAAAREKPGEIAYSSSGSGTASHLASELLNDVAKIRTLHIPFRGTAPAITAVVSGEVAFMFSAQASTLPLIKAGKLRAIAYTGSARSAEQPDLPTVSEAGLPGFEVINWQGFLVPAGVPRDIVARLHADIVATLAAPEVRSRLSTGGSQIVGNTPEQFGAFIRSEITKWAGVVRSANIKAD